ncbi:MAG: hypothetical protein JF606_08520 [Burkholderiales bacterium]|jgi:hypothetical protein|nr:hypothetical protein [Burkholderiales bacterium]
MIKRVISVGLFALGAGTLWSLSKQMRLSGRQEVPKAKPVPVQRWEGEGGALPMTGAQTGPDPAVLPAEKQREDEVQSSVH